MSDYHFEGLADPTLLANPSQRLPAIFLTDTSESMKGHPIEQLNKALDQLLADLKSDAMARKSVEVAVVKFGGTATVHQPFATIDNITRLSGLSAGGYTPMAEAIEKGIDLIEERLQSYVATKVSKLKPWLWLLTDGRSSTSLDKARPRLNAMEAQGRITVFTLGVDGADFATLATLSTLPPLKLANANFPDLFKWIGPTLKAATRTRPGDKIDLPPFPASLST